MQQNMEIPDNQNTTIGNNTIIYL